MLEGGCLTLVWVLPLVIEGCFSPVVGLRKVGGRKTGMLGGSVKLRILVRVYTSCDK